MPLLFDAQDMADTFIKDPSVDFPPGRLVACKVLAVKVDEGLVDLSLRPSAVVGKAAYKLHLEDMHEGMKVGGYIGGGHGSTLARIDDDKACIMVFVDRSKGGSRGWSRMGYLSASRTVM